MSALAQAEAMERFGSAYAEHRAGEGRGYGAADLLALPYLKRGPLARQWSVRARTFDAFCRNIVRPMTNARGRVLRIADLGAGNGWLSYRLAIEGHRCTAIDIRADEVDGLGAARFYLDRAPFDRVVSSFDALPLPDDSFDLAVFNASIHYATALGTPLAEAARAVRPGGRIVILDSPFYGQAESGAAMVAEKHATARSRFGDRAESLLGLPFIEFLTADGLQAISEPLGLTWRRHRVHYPLWYELRPLKALLTGARTPSRFDLWDAEIQ